MRIGQVATAVGVTAQTIRFYERKGLLPPPQRTANGYRTYDEQTLTRLRFIRHAQGAGLTLHEITAIIDLRGTGASPCAHVSELLSTKLHEVQTRQRELAALEAELHTLVSRGARLDPADCTDTEICHLIAPPFRVRPPEATTNNVRPRPHPPVAHTPPGQARGKESANCQSRSVATSGNG